MDILETENWLMELMALMYQRMGAHHEDKESKRKMSQSEVPILFSTTEEDNTSEELVGALVETVPIAHIPII